MEFKDLLRFIDEESERLKQRFGNYPDQEKRILARTVKLAEEVGELCNEVLAFNAFQRKEKLDKHTRESLEGEFADVCVTTLLLAEAMNVDIGVALKNKIEKIEARYTAK